ncbi:hypothetical protein ES705_25927 [subsurface metagenome]
MKIVPWIVAGILVVILMIGVIVNEAVDISLPFFSRLGRRALVERAAKVDRLVAELADRETAYHALTELGRARDEKYEDSLRRAREAARGDAERLDRLENSLRAARAAARIGEAAITRGQGALGDAQSGTQRFGGLLDELGDYLRNNPPGGGDSD